MPIKYLGSKRTLIPTLSRLAELSGAQSAVDLFSGTTRVAQGFKKLGIEVTANDLAAYAYVFEQAYIATDSSKVDMVELQRIIDVLNALPGNDGYFTENFSRKAWFFQQHNATRVDAIRQQLADNYTDHPYFYILLTSLIEAADRVDSTTGVQMAYLKKWAARSYNDMKLVIPDLLPGRGTALLGDAVEVVAKLDPTDLMYLDPPYNQHRYDSNYHIWNTLTLWDAPEGYGIANKRVDLQEDGGKSAFNSKRSIESAMAEVIANARAKSLIVSFNNEGYMLSGVIRNQLAAVKEHVVQLDIDFKRYVGAQIGIHNPAGQKVGAVKALRNVEHIFIATDDAAYAAAVKQEFASVLTDLAAERPSPQVS